MKTIHLTRPRHNQVHKASKPGIAVMARSLVQGSAWLALLILALWSHSAFASTEATPGLQGYRHVAWTGDNGGINSAHSIAQDKEGYLWAIGPQGMYRFDGVEFQTIDSLTAGELRSSDIINFITSAQGGLWIMSASKGLLRYSNGKTIAQGATNCTPRTRDPSLVETPDGDLWIRTYAGLYRYHEHQCVKVVGAQGLGDQTFEGIFLDREGTLWGKTESGELLFLPKGQVNFQRNPFGNGKDSSVVFLRQGPDGAIWLSDDLGLRRVTAGSGRASASNQSFLPPGMVGGAFVFDHNGGIWILTKTGVRHITNPKALATFDQGSPSPDEELFTTADGLTSDSVWDITQDKEGSIWVATDGGIDRLSATVFVQQPLPKARDHLYAVLPDEAGSVWTGNWDSPLMLASGRRVKRFEQLNNSIISTLRDRTGGLWFSGGENGQLFHQVKGKMVPVSAPTSGGNPGRDVAIDRQGAVWLTLVQGGVYRLLNGAWLRQDQLLGVPAGTPCTLVSDQQGGIRIAYFDKLLFWDAERTKTFTAANGLMSGYADTLSVAGDRLWMGGRLGVGIFRNDHFSKLSPKDQDAFGRVTGVLETEAGDVWLNGAVGIFRISAAEIKVWLANSAHIVSYRKFTGADGIIGNAGARYPLPSIAKGENGRTWFATTKGLFWTDEGRLQSVRNTLPPPVNIESMKADGHQIAFSDGVHLGADSSNIEIGYAALTMVNPARVSYKYRLDGLDRTWQGADSRRQAYYTNLAPGQYTFHVIASNNDGIWNDVGAALAFSVPPKFYQTLWFKFLILVALALTIILLFRLRVRRATAIVGERLAAQVAERERIARELHDTLLQGFYGVILGFQTAADQTPLTDSSRTLFESALQSAEKAVNEGRDRVRGLRGEAESLDLGDELATTAQEHSGSQCPVLSIEVEGAPRLFHPLVREEMGFIAREAIANSYKHAEAKSIAVRLIYGAHWFRLSIVDDGKGIEAGVREAGGRANHWGLKGMRERARNIGAKYFVKSSSGEGCVVELSIAAKLAYWPIVQNSHYRIVGARPGTEALHPHR